MTTSAAPAAPAPGRLLRQGVHTVAVRSATLACRVALLVVIGRSLSPADYGVYALIGTLGTFGTVIFGLNLYIYVYRAVPGLPANEQMRVFKSTSTFELAGAAGVVFCVFASGGLPYLARQFNAPGYEVFFAVGLVQIVLLVAIAEITHFLSAQAKIEDANWVDFLAQGAWVLVPVGLWLAGARPGLAGFVVGQLAGVFAAVAFATYRIGLRAWWSQRIDRTVIRNGLAFSLPMIVPAISVYSLKLADRPMLSHYASLADVGVYAFAFAFLNTLYSFTAGVVFATVGPRIIAAHNAGEPRMRDALQTYMLKAALGAFVVPAVLMFALARPLLAVVARPEYAPAATVMPLVALSFLFIILTYPAHTLLTMRDQVRTLAVIDTVGMGVGLAGNFILIPHFSYWGAAAASAFGFAVTMVLKYGASGMMRCLRTEVLFSFRHEAAALRRQLAQMFSAAPVPASAAKREYLGPIEPFDR